MGVTGVAESSVFFLVKEVAIADILVGIVTREGLWRHLLVRVTEVDVAHVVGVVKEIGIQGIVVPEVVLIILAF